MPILLGFEAYFVIIRLKLNLQAADDDLPKRRQAESAKLFRGLNLINQW
jgi:hypothetical protein